MKMTCWQDKIESERARTRDHSAVVLSTLSTKKLLAPFDGSYGSADAEPFFLWTEERVYFATEYDGAESVGSVPRDPRRGPAEYV